MQKQIMGYRVVRAVVGIVVFALVAWIWACLWVPLS
jgi:hypothetical protein